MSSNKYPPHQPYPGEAMSDFRSYPVTESARETIALEIWHRFADSGVEEWQDETHKAEYLLCADAILALLLFSAPAPVAGLYISEPEPRESGPILIGDADHNDIAEFYHSDHATVGQSYETALMLARKLVDASADPICETCNGDGKIDQRLGGMATSSVVPCPDCADDRTPQPLHPAQASPVMEFPLDAGLHNLAFPETALALAKQMVEDSRARAEMALVRDSLAWMEERAKNSTSFGSHCHAYEVAARHLKLALDGDDVVPPPASVCVEDLLTDIIAHLGASIIQSVPTDDQIIMDHVKAAHELAKAARRQLSKVPA